MAAGHGERFALRPEEVSIPAGSRWARLPALGGAAGAVGLVLSLALATRSPEQFYFSWLVAFLYFLSLALGALFFVLIHFAMQGGWGVAVRRIGEVAAATLPLFALLFVPVLLGRETLFPWTVPGAAEADALLRGKSPYLNVPFFLARAAVYFVLWTAIAFRWLRGSRAQDESGDLGISLRLRKWSGPAIIALALTQTFAAIDWIMSLDPHWYSTMFGVYYFAGSFVGWFALLAILAVSLRRAGVLRDVLRTDHLHDIGKLVFAFTVFWAYIAFSQYFLIWYANIPEETHWYHVRLHGSWQAVAVLLAVGHFAAPFLFFIGRDVKRRAPLLVSGAVWILLMHFLDLHWLVMPALHEHGVAPTVLDAATFLAVGGFSAGAFGWVLRRQAVVPVRDPRLSESLGYENA